MGEKKWSVINRFLAIRKKHHDSEIVISIVNLINKSNKFKVIYYNIGDELENLTMTEFRRNKEFKNLIKQTIGDQHSTEVEKKKWKQWTNQQETKISFKIITPSKKKENIKSYTKIRIKSRNSLSNIS